MKLLHISDLHITFEGETLESVWTAPAASLQDGQFDFIIISGDLSQAAADREYEALQRLIGEKLLRLLRVQDVWRIVMVPGNHDVDWNHTLPEWTPAACRVDPRALSKEWRNLAQAPEQSRLRVEIGEGQARFFDIGVCSQPGVVAPNYLHRFENVHRFLRSVYGDPPPGCKGFNLLSDGDDWSMHVFEDEKIAFFGLNSCSRNDKCWIGASFNRAAMVRVHEKAHQLRQRWGHDSLVVAVWHHGLDADRGRPDRLGASEIGLLYNAGIRVGFHGHVHQDVSHSIRLLDRSMVIVSTGSVGARAADRPEGLGNQFGVVDLNPAYVHVERFERNANGVYAPRSSVLFPLAETPSYEVQTKAFVRTQTRKMTISREGIARIDVALSQVTNPSGLVLALAGAPYGNVLGDREACMDGQMVEIRRNPAGDGRSTFELPPIHHGRCDSITWGMRMSNVVTLTKTDLTDLGLSPRRSTFFPNCPDGFDQLSTKVMIPSDELKLVFEFEKGAGNIEDTRLMVEQEHDTHGVTSWTVDRGSVSRCSIVQQNETVEVVCRYPEVGQRYSLLYRISAAGEAPSSDACALAAHLLDMALRSPPRRDAFDVVGGLTLGVREAVVAEMAPGAPRELGLAWIGMLWDRDRKRLFPAFGDFSRPEWSLSFGAGESAEGHAFRFSRICGWHPQAEATRIFAAPQARARREPDPVFERSWNLSIPLLLKPGGPAIGVVCLNGGLNETPDGRVEHELQMLAERWSRAFGTDEIPEGCTDLLRAVNVAFWKSLSRLEGQLSPSPRVINRALSAFVPQRAAG